MVGCPPRGARTLLLFFSLVSLGRPAAACLPFIAASSAFDAALLHGGATTLVVATALLPLGAAAELGRRRTTGTILLRATGHLFGAAVGRILLLLCAGERAD